MRRQRVSVICPVCEKRYRRVPRSSEFGMIHYGVCKAGHFMSGCMTLHEWKATWKAKTYGEKCNHAVRRFIIDRKLNALFCRKLTKLLIERGRLSGVIKQFDAAAPALAQDVKDFSKENP